MILFEVTLGGLGRLLLLLFSCTILIFERLDFFYYHLGGASWLSIGRPMAFSAMATAYDTMSSDDTWLLHWRTLDILRLLFVVAVI